MKLLEVSLEDGRNCAQLINLLKAGRENLFVRDLPVYEEVTKWLHSVATQMAEQLKNTNGVRPAPSQIPAAESTGMKITKMGPISTNPVPTAKRNRKSKK